jgi:hypothetical protein
MSDGGVKLRFTLLELLAVITVIAIGCVALQNASLVAVSLLFSLILILISLSGIRAVYATDQLARAQSLGFLMSAGLYFTVAFGPGFSTTVAPGLPSGTLAQEFVYPALSAEVPASSRKLPEGTPVTLILGGITYVTIPLLPDFTRVSHALCVLLFGIAGAAISRWFAAQSNHPRSN